ncbi:potassium channel family protein [Arthrobacter koreensis]|jgi:voltage-gated potassium channel|uniref:Potassium channel family protein n=2 Tax=Arthrobacter koreensis TaxID=199136 RepID=A0ABY6FQH6_9MICC|nr:potassium channel family protein [Arthrobacter koreensis]MDF2498364.1 Ion channel [Arthrobacter koreensis]MEB7448710.1 potassium channel family protein [Arthrobacter koreensis]UYB35009.1 potassium channel family protein [Arthrobacter koreensis]
MKRLHVLWNIIRVTSADVVFYGFLAVYVGAAVVLPLFEPGIPRFGDALWYLFVSFTTIGFGDFVAVTFVGRLLTVLVSLYGILVVALTTGVIVGFYNQLIRARTRGTLQSIVRELEHLPELSREQLIDLSRRVRERHLLD